MSIFTWLHAGLTPPEAVYKLQNPPSLPVFKTIKVGTDIRLPRRPAAGRLLHQWLDTQPSVQLHFYCPDQEEDVDLVVLTTSQLMGQENGGTTAEVFAGAARIGLEKCLPEDGPQLRLQFLDQPMDEWLLIGMEPIAGSGDDFPSVFRVN